MAISRTMLMFSLVAGFTLVSGCVVSRTSVREVDPATDPARVVSTPLRVHMWDGTTVVFRDGASVSAESVSSEVPGVRYDLRLGVMDTVRVVAVDSIAAIELFTDAVRPAETFLLTTLGIGATVVGAGLAAIILFGSCPTIYAETDTGPELQAEAFSYAIAPSFEQWDEAPISVIPDADGSVRLEIRNEALETHYINALDMRAVLHGADERAVAGQVDEVYVLGGETGAIRAVDASGRVVTPAVSEADGHAFRSPADLLESASSDAPNDFLDVEFEVPAAADSAVLALRLRNTLLTTVLFYEAMLADQGPEAVRWLGETVNHGPQALGLWLWTQRHLGLRVSVWDGEAYRLAGRVRDTGPLAWREVGLVVPVLSPGRLRVRLELLADSWMIDRVVAAPSWRRAEARSLPLTGVTEPDGRLNAEALAGLASDDDHYVVTRPGQSMFVDFDAAVVMEPPEAVAPPVASFFLSSKGYYTEWIRQEWLRSDRPRRFEANLRSVDRVLALWRERKPTIERAFFETRVGPVR